MGLNTCRPEGWRTDTPESRTAMANMTALMDACRGEKIPEGRALVCDSFHSLLMDLGHIRGLIPWEEDALDIREDTVRGITIISHANRPICFVTTGFQKDDAGNPIAVLSRKTVQEKCRREYVEKLRPDDMTNTRVTHLGVFGAFVGIGCGTISLLPIGAIFASRIDHPKERFTTGMDVHTIIRPTEGGRITLTQKELLGTWEESVTLLHTDETVAGTIRSTEPYGILVELAPNLAGLVEIEEGVLLGQQASVYIKSILPLCMKIKLVIIDTSDYPYCPIPPKYFFKGNHMDRFVYSPECSDE